MTQRIARLYRLLSRKSHCLLGVTTLLLVVERLVLAAAAIGFTRRLLVTWTGFAIVVALWSLRGWFRQLVTTDVRQKVTMTIARAALDRGASGSFLPGEEGDAAVFEGRQAAEAIVRLLPSLAAEPIAALALLLLLRPTAIPVLAGAAAVAVSAVAMMLVRSATARRQKAAWSKYLAAAHGTLTSIRAATELVASGHELVYLERLQVIVDDWSRAAIRAERSAALFQRIPYVAAVVIGVSLLAGPTSVELAGTVRIGVFFPPLAGLTRAIFELIRSAPRIQTLDAAFVGHGVRSQTERRFRPPSLPCEIRFEKVSFAYEGVPALTDLSFTWPAGRILGIRGPNGSGKSTLLKLILGLLEPDAGRIVVGGVDLREIDLPDWRRSIAYLPQRPYVPEKFTVLQAMQLTAPDLRADEAKSALEQVGTWDRIVRRVSTDAEALALPMNSLSVGVRQRVLLARVLAQRSSLVLLDEPDENLDFETREMLVRLARERGETQTLGIATHDETLLAAATEIVDLRSPELSSAGVSPLRRRWPS